MITKLPDAVEQALDAYADAFHAAMLPDGGLSFADGLVASIKKNELRAAIHLHVETVTTEAVRVDLGAPIGHVAYDGSGCMMYGYNHLAPGTKIYAPKGANPNA